MQERNDGSFGDIMDGQELMEKLQKDAKELGNTKAIHFGTEESLKAMKEPQPESQNPMGTQDRLGRIEEKLDMVIKHFKIVRIIGEQTV